MPVIVQAYFANILDQGALATLVDHLNARVAPPAIALDPFVALTPPEWMSDEPRWRVSDLADHETIPEWIESGDEFPLLLDGPCHMELSIATNLFCAWHPYRWRVFQEDLHVQEAFRGFIGLVARAVGCDTVIYAPDCYNFALEGDTLDSAKAWLAQHCGPPPPEIPAYHYHQAGYFIEKLD
jgi:hypothetical protein